MTLRGSDAAERRGMVWALSDKHDHPAGILMKARNRVSRRSTNGISIKKEEVMQSTCHALHSPTFRHVEKKIPNVYPPRSIGVPSARPVTTEIKLSRTNME